MSSNSIHNYSQSALDIESSIRQYLSPQNYSESLITSAVGQALDRYHQKSSNPPHQSAHNLSNPLIESAVRQALKISHALPLITEKEKSLVDSLMIMLMLMIGLGIAAVVTTLYIRALQKKKESQVYNKYHCIKLCSRVSIR